MVVKELESTQILNLTSVAEEFGGFPEVHEDLCERAKEGNIPITVHDGQSLAKSWYPDELSVEQTTSTVRALDHDNPFRRGEKRTVYEWTYITFNPTEIYPESILGEDDWTVGLHGAENVWWYDVEVRSIGETTPSGYSTPVDFSDGIETRGYKPTTVSPFDDSDYIPIEADV